MALVEKRYRFLFGSLYVAFMLFGTSMTIVGASLPRILSDFGWAYTTAGAVIAAGSLGYFVGAYAGGKVLRFVGLKVLLVTGLALDAVGLAFFAATPAPAANFFLNLAIGVGQGLIELAIDTGVMRMDTEGSGRAMNLMHASFAIGAVAGPFIVGILLKSGLPWTLVYRGLAALCALLAVSAVASSFGDLDRPSVPQTGAGGRSLLGRPVYWLGALALFLYVGVEIGVSNWVAEFFVRVFGVGAAAGSFMVSLFWAGLLVGRVGVPALYHGTRKGKVLVLFAALAMVSVAALTLIGFLAPPHAAGAGPFGTAAILGAVATGFIGLGCSIIYPTVITIVGESFPDAQSEAIGFAATGGGIGSFSFPFLMSAIAQGLGIRAGFLSYSLFAVCTAAACLSLARAFGRRRAA